MSTAVFSKDLILSGASFASKATLNPEPGPFFSTAVFDGRSGFSQPHVRSRFFILVVPDGTSVPDFFGAGLLETRVLHLERFGSPVISRVRVGVYGPEGSVVPDPPIWFGPSSSQGPLVLWPSSIYAGLGTRLWRDDPTLQSVIYRSVRGELPVWVKPGFPFTLPNDPLTLPDLDGRPLKGLLCASVTEPGAWILLSHIDISRLLGLVSPVSTYGELHREIGAAGWKGILHWAASFPNSVN